MKTSFVKCPFEKTDQIILSRTDYGKTHLFFNAVTRPVPLRDNYPR